MVSFQVLSHVMKIIIFTYWISDLQVVTQNIKLICSPITPDIVFTSRIYRCPLHDEKKHYYLLQILMTYMIRNDSFNVTF